MLGLVLLAIVLAPFIMAVLRTRASTAAAANAISAVYDDNFARAEDFALSFYRKWVIPVFWVAYAAHVLLMAGSVGVSWDWVSSGFIQMMLAGNLLFAMVAGIMLLVFDEKVTIYIFVDPITNIETQFSSREKFERAHPGLTAAQVDAAAVRTSHPRGLMYWALLLYVTGAVNLAVYYGAGIQTGSASADHARALILMGWGWAIVLWAEVFGLMLLGAFFLFKVVGLSERLLNILLSVVGSALPITDAQKKELEAFFKRPDIGEEQTYIPWVTALAWKTLAIICAMLLPSLFFLDPIKLYWLDPTKPVAEAYALSLIIVIGALMLWLKAEFKTGETVDKVKDGYSWIAPWRERGFKIRVGVLALLVGLFILYVILNAVEWWQPAIKQIIEWKVRYYDHTNYFQSGWSTVIAVLLCMLMIGGLLTFAEEADMKWAKKLAAIPALVAFLAVAAFIWRYSTAKDLNWDWPWSSTASASQTSTPRQVGGHKPVGAGTTASSRNPYLDAHCAKFGCDPDNGKLASPIRLPYRSFFLNPQAEANSLGVFFLKRHWLLSRER